MAIADAAAPGSGALVMGLLPDHQRVRAGLDGLHGGGDPRLVVAGDPGRADPRRDQQDVEPTSARTAATSWGEQTRPRAAGRDGERRHPAHGVAHGAADAKVGQVLAADRSQQGHPGDQRLRRGLHGRLGSARPRATRRVHGEDLGPQLGHRAGGSRHGVGYVMQLEVEEDLRRSRRPAYRGDHPWGRTAGTAPEPILTSGHVRRDQRRPVRCGVDVRRVERDGDRLPAFARDSPFSVGVSKVLRALRAARSRAEARLASSRTAGRGSYTAAANRRRPWWPLGQYGEAGAQRGRSPAAASAGLRSGR